MSSQKTRTSKFLSLVLRHKPEVIGMELDADGWLDIDALLQNAKRHGHEISLERLHDIVATSDKQRFALSSDGLKIRANQGHSVSNVNLNLDPVEPPDVLYHGTIAAFLPPIRTEGLSKRSRNHVHLSADLDTARQVGARRGKPVLLTVAASQMHAEGFKFYRSSNGVWLTESVPPKFISFPDDME